MPLYRVDFNHDQLQARSTWDSWEIWVVPEAEFPKDDATLNEVFEVSSGNYVVYSLYLPGKTVPLAFIDGCERITNYLNRTNCSLALGE